MEKHFVTFNSPGTFFHETTTKPIESWDVKAAQAMAAEITERYNAKPFCFYFTTRSRTEDDLDSKVTATSPTYYLPHCKVETLSEIKERDDPADSILISNMECNDWPRVVTTTEGWKVTVPFKEGDVLL